MRCLRLLVVLIISVFLAGVPGSALTSCCNDVHGYYWRDYTGEVPDDAIPGGTDVTRIKTYIGHTLHPGHSLLPGEIRQDRKMYYEFHTREHSATEDVKILCSQHPEQLQWITTKGGELVASLRKDQHLIVGGHDLSRPLAIGRKAIPSGEVKIGKVLIEDGKFISIFLGKDGKGWSDSTTFEILIYKPNIIGDQKECVQNECYQKVININIY